MFDKEFDKEFDKVFDMVFDNPFDKPFDKPLDKEFDKSFDKPFDKPLNSLLNPPFDPFSWGYAQCGTSSGPAGFTDGKTTFGGSGDVCAAAGWENRTKPKLGQASSRGNASERFSVWRRASTRKKQERNAPRRSGGWESVGWSAESHKKRNEERNRDKWVSQAARKAARETSGKGGMSGRILSSTASWLMASRAFRRRMCFGRAHGGRRERKSSMRTPQPVEVVLEERREKPALWETSTIEKVMDA